MALWIDKHRPKDLEELSIQPQANTILRNICNSYSFPHLLFSGPPGSGKKTRVMAFLRALFKTEIELGKMRSEYRTIEINDSKNIEVQVTSSPFHVELTPADSGNNDRHVISFFLKEIAQSQMVNKSVPIKIVIINEAHRLSRLAQQALRRTMEKYAQTCRIILICDSLSQIIEPVRSRCLIIRTPRVSSEQVSIVVNQILVAEKLELAQELLTQLVAEAQGNLRRAINLVQMLSIQKKSSSVQQIIPEWEKYTDELVKIMIESDISPDTMKKIRNHLYELLVHCVPPTEIFKRILTRLCAKSDPQLIPQITEAAAVYEARMQNGTKPIFHLEAFVARFICIYRDYLADVAS
ncbi:Subunit of heteropentameric Replication factor C (RF-C) [Tritrichomonas musculus]|uniref:Subunit of heteropentameric Replication factor C (RF-C) n=1 Tax=Tritrichomonas musculus TaxID=1915356 RepID=A0ABR2LAQ5_9EUKA